MSIIPANKEVEVGRLLSDAAPGKASMRPYLKNQLKKK
jgi:hypothetical protein